ncbi:MAG: rhodopsin [Flavobacteriaceae bacterium]|jgi:bacteriorhodopsin|nr:rhodopsin [Flavobacteriaceae bacterium]|tara:strand:- start:568 stop:1293 length:726 start_codon:yes stop_codon:yes gene_type:complete
MTNLFYIINDHGGMSLEEFTFFIGTMALMGASAFFFLSLSQFDKKWRNSVLISGLITFIAAVHYYYMRGELGPDGSAGDITSIRYIDWILTVPLMCVEFYLLLKVAGATTKHLRDLIVLSLIMLITGYVGEAGMGNAALYGFFSGVAYFAIVYMIKFGDLAKLAKSAGGSVEKAHNTLFWFVLVGWAIYPLGYMIGTADGQWYSFMANVGLDMNVVYNIGDAINKIGFGLVVYAAAVKETK